MLHFNWRKIGKVICLGGWGRKADSLDQILISAEAPERTAYALAFIGQQLDEIRKANNATLRELRSLVASAEAEVHPRITHAVSIGRFQALQAAPRVAPAVNDTEAGA